MKVFGRKMFVVDSQRGEASPDDTAIVLVHGYPTSSFDYARAWEHLTATGKRVIAFDHVGFGFSDKPTQDFAYSLLEHAENVVELLRQLELKGVHLVGHDMGDSVVTELLTRFQRAQLPQQFHREFVKSVTFTNGGMLVKQINFRITQRIMLIWPGLSAVLARIDESSRIAKQQLNTLWGNPENPHKDDDIDAMVALNRYNGGIYIIGKLMAYLHDRFAFESRWLASLARLPVPIQFVWSTKDAVSPISIATDISGKLADHNNRLQVAFIEGAGHFLMLEEPERYANYVLQWTAHYDDDDE